MGTVRLDRLLHLLTGRELVEGLLMAGLVVFTIALLTLIWTRWGEFHPLFKCVVLSLLAHVLLLGYARTVQILTAAVLIEEPAIEVSFVENSSQEATALDDPVRRQEPWEQFVHDAVVLPEPVEPQRELPDAPPEPQRKVRTEPGKLPGDPSLEHLALNEPRQPKPEMPAPDAPPGREPSEQPVEPVEVPEAQRHEAPPIPMPAAPPLERPAVPSESQSPMTRPSEANVAEAPFDQLVPPLRLAVLPTTPDPDESLNALTDRLTDLTHPKAVPSTDASAVPYASGAEVGTDPADAPAYDRPEESGRPSPASKGSGEGKAKAPDLYRLRVSPERSRLAERHGATPETEAAVKAALKWLAANQGPDGRWDAGDHGAGRETKVASRDRLGAGIEADTGMTGLAMLAFLASGHTHLEGAYRENVRLGLQYLMRAQASDGNLFGRASPYAKMYCHAMATLALSEAYAMTGDQRLRETVRRAVGFTVAAQDSTAGGFRYKPGDPGDTSQCGWQLMALKSAELAGISIPTRTRNGMIRFLRSVASGSHGGLAAYRPQEKVSRTMTAEALVCRQFLGMSRQHPAGNEAGDYLLGELPGQGEKNLYYWYYATLAMYQLQGTHWQQWNDAMQKTLVESQQKQGSLAGSWDPDTVWGGYGGRVYSTALATLCLEVYYRFLPLYTKTTPGKRPAEAR